MKWILLDFGTKTTKALQVRLEGQRLRVEGFHRWESKPDYFKGLGFPEAPAWSAATIELNELDWLRPDEETIVMCGLPSAYLETRYLHFPFKQPKKIEKVLQFELEALIPYDIEDVNVRHRVLEGDGVVPNKKEALVLTTSYRRDPIKTFEAELRKFQINLPPITSQNLALSTLRQAILSDPLFGILELGHSKSQFLFQQKSGQILALRSFWWGGKNIVSKLSQALNMDEPRAEQLFYTYDPLKAPEAVTRHIEGFFHQLTAELRQTLKSLATSGLQLPKPFPVYVLGGTSKSNALLGFVERELENEFDVQFRPYPLNTLAKQVPGLDQISDPEEAVQALSLALTQLRSHRNRIPNFSETGFQLQQNLRRLKTGSFQLLKRLALLMIAPFLYAVLHYFVQANENEVVMSGLSQTLKSAGIKVEKNESTDRTVNRLKTELSENRQNAQQMQTDTSSPLFVLQRVSELLPNQLVIDVRDFKVTETSILISAEAPTEAMAKQIVDALKIEWPAMKVGSFGTCATKKDCKTLTVEIERKS